MRSSEADDLRSAHSELSALARECSAILDSRAAKTSLTDFDSKFGSNLSSIQSNNGTTLASTPRDSNPTSSSNSPRNPAETSIDITRLKLEQKHLREDSAKYRLRCADWEAKASSLAENLADMQSELMSKNQQILAYKQKINENEANHDYKLTSIREKHSNELGVLNKKAQDLDEKNLALAGQIRMLEQDLMKRDGKISKLEDSYFLDAHKQSLASAKKNFKMEVSKIQLEYLAEKEKAEMNRIQCAKLDIELEKERNDSNAKSRQLKLLRNEVKSLQSGNQQVFSQFTKESSDLQEHCDHLKYKLDETNEVYGQKVKHLTIQLKNLTDLKNDLSMENEKLLSQINSDVKTFANAKNMKLALNLVQSQKKKLEQENKRLRNQIQSLQKANDTKKSATGKELASLIQRNDLLTKRNIELDSRTSQLEAKFNSAKVHTEKLESELERKESEFDRLLSVKDKLMTKVGNLENDVQHVKQNQESEHQNSEKQLIALQKETFSLKEMLKKMSRQYQAKNTESEALLQKIANLEKQIKLEQKENKDLINTITDLKLANRENDEKPWKAVFDSTNEEREKLAQEVRKLKEEQFVWQSTQLDLQHEKKRVHNLEKQLVAKNSEIAKLNAKVSSSNNGQSSFGQSSSHEKFFKKCLKFF